jgi:hypothetical protein
MGTPFRSIERAKEELAQLQSELLKLENRVGTVHDSIAKAIVELFGTDRRTFSALQEAALAVRVAEAVVSRLPAPSQGLNIRNKYVREREAADYMGIKVSTLRAWRLRRSKNGPPFTRVGRTVMYPMAELESHMRSGLVLHRR